MYIPKLTEIHIENLYGLRPIIFFGLMLTVLAIIMIIWLLACGILLQLPLMLNKPFDSLGFVFGYVWGFFASSWALLALLQPNLTYFDSFTRVLTLHLQGAPLLYCLHGLCLVALICWSFFLYNGLLTLTNARTGKIIKISFILCALFLISTFIYLIFSDQFLTECQPINTNSNWFSSWFTKDTITPSSSQEMITNSINILNEASCTTRKMCQGLDDAAFHSAANNYPNAFELKKKAALCHNMESLWNSASHRVNLEFARSEGQQPNLSGIQRGLQNITEKVVTPAAELALESACSQSSC